MYPDNNQPFGVEYLDQIATKPPKKSFGGTDKRFLIIGGLLLVMIIVVIIAVSAGGSRGLPNAEVLGSRLIGLNSLITFGQTDDNITEPDIRQFVAETAIIRAGDRVQLARIYGQNEAYSKPSATALAQESVDELLAALETAKTTGQVNEMFRDALATKIRSVVAVLRSSLASVDDMDARQIIQGSIDDYEMVLSRFVD